MNERMINCFDKARGITTELGTEGLGTPILKYTIQKKSLALHFIDKYDETVDMLKFNSTLVHYVY